MPPQPMVSPSVSADDDFLGVDVSGDSELSLSGSDASLDLPGSEIKGSAALDVNPSSSLYSWTRPAQDPENSPNSRGKRSLLSSLNTEGVSSENHRASPMPASTQTPMLQSSQAWVSFNEPNSQEPGDDIEKARSSSMSPMEPLPCSESKKRDDPNSVACAHPTDGRPHHEINGAPEAGFQQHTVQGTVSMQKRRSPSPGAATPSHSNSRKKTPESILALGGSLNAKVSQSKKPTLDQASGNQEIAVDSLQPTVSSGEKEKITLAPSDSEKGDHIPAAADDGIERNRLDQQSSSSEVKQSSKTEGKGQFAEANDPTVENEQYGYTDTIDLLREKSNRLRAIGEMGSFQAQEIFAKVADDSVRVYTLRMLAVSLASNIKSCCNDIEKLVPNLQNDKSKMSTRAIDNDKTNRIDSIDGTNSEVLNFASQQTQTEQLKYSDIKSIIAGVAPTSHSSHGIRQDMAVSGRTYVSPSGKIRSRPMCYNKSGNSSSSFSAQKGSQITHSPESSFGLQKKYSNADSCKEQLTFGEDKSILAPLETTHGKFPVLQQLLKQEESKSTGRSDSQTKGSISTRNADQALLEAQSLKSETAYNEAKKPPSLDMQHSPLLNHPANTQCGPEHSQLIDGRHCLKMFLTILLKSTPIPGISPNVDLDTLKEKLMAGTQISQVALENALVGKPFIGLAHQPNLKDTLKAALTVAVPSSGSPPPSGFRQVLSWRECVVYAAFVFSNIRLENSSPQTLEKSCAEEFVKICDNYCHEVFSQQPENPIPMSKLVRNWMDKVTALLFQAANPLPSPVASSRRHAAASHSGNQVVNSDALSNSRSSSPAVTGSMANTSGSWLDASLEQAQDRHGHRHLKTPTEDETRSSSASQNRSMSPASQSAMYNLMLSIQDEDTVAVAEGVLVRLQENSKGESEWFVSHVLPGCRLHVAVGQKVTEIGPHRVSGLNRADLQRIVNSVVKKKGVNGKPKRTTIKVE